MNTQSQHSCDKDVSNDKALKFIGQKNPYHYQDYKNLT